MPRATDSITNSEDIIDSRDVIARIEYLTDDRDNLVSPDGKDWPDDDTRNQAWADENGTDADELAVLLALQEEAEGYAADWKYGEALIRDSYFQDYAQELADDIGAIKGDATWPNNHIDWEAAARELQQDYTSVEFDGVTYWVR